MAFSTMGSEEKKANKKKEITGYKCGKSGNYSHKCDEVETVKTSNTNIANKKGSNFLVLKEDTEYSSSEAEAISTDNEEEELEEPDGGNYKHKELNDDKDYDNNEKEDPDKDSDENDEDMDDDYEGFTFLQGDGMCSLQDKPDIPMSWILLDSKSMIDVFSNNKLLTNIRDSNQTLTLYCNSGNAIITQKGDLKGYGSVWYYPKGIANNLSFRNVEKIHKVTYDSFLKTGFVMHKAANSNHVFIFN